MNVLNKLLCIFLWITLAYAESNSKDSNIYWDDSNEFISKTPTFIEQYFYKPFNNIPYLTGDIKILTMNGKENLEEICNQIKGMYDKNHQTCWDLDRNVEICKHPKTPKEMQIYIAKSFEIPYNSYNSEYMFVDDNICGYMGKVEMFGYIWEFNSRGGSIELSRTIADSENIISITQDSLKAYKQGMIQKRYGMDGITFKRYLICDSIDCNPRAESIND